MFVVETASGLRAGSASLLADAIDFAGDAASYGVSLAVLSAGLAWRARTAALKAACMMGFGVFVLVRAAWGAIQGVVPDATVMGAISLLVGAVGVVRVEPGAEQRRDFVRQPDRSDRKSVV